MPVRLEITGLAGGGRGVARSGGKVWFVAGALPGEVVDAEVERERAGIVEARTREVIAASPWREPAPCPVAGACGGCDLTHLQRAAASEVLRSAAIGALRHAPPVLADAVREAPVRVSAMGWRLRARLHWDSAHGVLGFRAARSHDVVAIAPCRVVSPLLLRALPEVAGALRLAGAGDGELEWIEDLAGEKAVAGWRGATVPDRPLGELAGFHRLTGDGEIVPGGWGETGVMMYLPVPLCVPVGVFFQGNRHLVPGLFATVTELVRAADPARVVDLYGGVGFLAAAAGHAGAGDVTVVEASRPAAAAARRNLPEATVIAAAAEAYLAAPGAAAGTLAIVDPPRTGLSRPAAEGLVRWRPERIVLLACDAARFGRDGGRLLASGYRLESAELWDLFAGSHHVEILASFSRGAA
jgi:23S rRNA (uracil1939-C5)-methyltransferase